MPLPWIASMSVTVRNTAVGSLLADSNSMSERSRFVRPIPRERRTEKTAAASVEDTTAPRSRPSSTLSFRIQTAAMPTTAAVLTTPTVESSNPPLMSGLERLDRSVWRPPSNRMSANAAEPTHTAILGSLNSMPPKPSDPASIPRSRKSSSDGTPYFVANPLASTLIISMVAPTSSM